MLGVILCGGESSRMGTDKGLINTDGKTWAVSAMEKMSELQVDVVLSVNDRQRDAYEQISEGTKLINDDKTILLKGPVLGILSVHVQYPQQDLFVLACDMPLMETALLHDLYSYYLQHQFHQAYVYTLEDEPDPVCSIYTCSGLTSILRMYHERRLVKHSMKFLLAQLDLFKCPIPSNKTVCFGNINTRSSLEQLGL